MERHDIVDMMRQLQLSGMRLAYDDVMRSGIQHKRSAAEILGDLLKAEIIEKTARSIRYQMSAAKFQVMKTLEEFNFDASPLNEELVRSLHGGSFLDQTRNAVFVALNLGRNRHGKNTPGNRYRCQHSKDPPSRQILQRR